LKILTIPFSEAFTRMNYDRWKTRTDFDDMPDEEPEHGYEAECEAAASQDIFDGQREDKEK